MKTWYLNILRLYIFYQYVYLPRFKVYANMLYDIHKIKLLKDEYLTGICDSKTPATAHKCFEEHLS